LFKICPVLAGMTIARQALIECEAQASGTTYQDYSPDLEC